MTARDHFAAAALTALIGAMRDETMDEICESAYGWADAILRERAKTNHDAAPAARASVGRPRTDKADLPTRCGTGDTPDSRPIAKCDTAEPVAWAVIIPLSDGRYAVDDFFLSLERANEACEWRRQNTPRGAEVMPLHRQPQPTLTDAELEAVDTAEASLMRESTDLTTPLPVRQRLSVAAATLRGLLERMK